MCFNQMPFDDAEDECCMWGKDSFLCSRFSFVKSVGGLENAEKSILGEGPSEPVGLIHDTLGFTT